MSDTFKQTGATTGELRIVIDKETVKEGLNRTFNRAKKDIQVPGFRKGKVPRKVFDRMYGEEALYEDTLNQLIPPAYAEAVEETGVEPVAEPELDIEEVGKDQDWVILAKIVTKPEVELGEYKGLDIHKQDIEVTDEEVEAFLEGQREEYAELVLKEDAAVEGDTVVIDYVGKIDGEEFEGGSAQNYSLELGSESFIPGFEDQLIGAEPGKTLDVKVTFPEDYGSEEVAGKDAVFEVTVHEVKERQLPELDDDFAQDIDDEVETLDELREKTHKELQESKEEIAREAKEDEAIRVAVENAEIEELPEAMIEEDTQRQMDIFLNNLQSQGIAPDMYFQMTNTSEDDLKEQMSEGSELRVRTNLVLEEIIAEEEIEASEEEKEKEIAELAETYELDEAMVRQSLTDDMLEHDIKMKKAIDLITDSANEVLEQEDEETEESEED